MGVREVGISSHPETKVAGDCAVSCWVASLSESQFATDEEAKLEQNTSHHKQQRRPVPSSVLRRKLSKESR